MINTKKILQNISFYCAQLFVPNICLGCASAIPYNGAYVCYECLQHLFPTNFCMIKENLAYNILASQTHIHHACSIYFFQDNSVIQHLIHAFKYKKQKKLARYLGNLSGVQLLSAPLYDSIDYVIPIPLHYNKFKKRGYNQAEEIAQGIAETMQIKMLPHALERIKNTKTQAQLKTKTERVENLKEAFMCTYSNMLCNKNILLVDDVLTTGATLKNAIETLHIHTGIKISVVTLALRI